MMALEAVITRIDGTLIRLESKIDRIEARLDRVEARMDQFATDLAELKGRVSQLPTVWQLMGMIIAVFGLAFALIRFGLPQ